MNSVTEKTIYGLKMNRPNSEYLDRILGTEFKVHEHGFIRVVDYMGNDSSVVQAARVSYGAGTKTVREDEGLIRYLMRHRHTSPFEMCLSGESLIPTFPCKGAKVKNYPIKKIAEAFQRGGKKNSWVKLIKIRTVNPETRVVSATKIKHAWKTGVKKVYKITVEDSFKRSVKVTSNHPILTPDGFRCIDEGLCVGDSIMLNGIPALKEDVIKEIKRRRQNNESIHSVAEKLGVSPSVVYKYAPKRVPRKEGFFRKPSKDHVDPRAVARRIIPKGICQVPGCDEYGRDIHHIDEDPYNNQVDNLIRLCPKHHRHSHNLSVLEKCFPCKIKSIEFIGEEDVYDLEVEDKNHTFVADGIVVHNCEIKFHIKLPIFVARQWIRHRTASVNEYSARYSILSNEFYNPSLVDMGGQSDINKQCREDEPIDNAGKVRQRIHNESQRNHEFYKWLLEPENGDVGIARELARMNLSLNFYTEWYWKINLHNLLNFITLRNHKFAQKEIVDYAKVINHIVGGWTPITHGAFVNYVRKSHSLSGEALKVAKALLQGQSIESQKSKLKESEWREMIQPLLD